MILNVGGRTDIVQYYSDWLFHRFKAGFVLSRNPLFPKKITRYELAPQKIDCVLFCSKNYEPALDRIHEISDSYNTYFHYTITAYGKDIEPGVPSIDQSIDTLLRLEKIVGKNRIAWRYDPVLLTKKYTIQQHEITFAHMAARLSGHIDRCIFSFVEMYRKLQFNMPELELLTEEAMEELAEIFGRIAKKNHIHLQTCASNADYSKYGIFPSGCVTLEMLGKANNVEFKDLKHRGMRRGCHCMTSHDIGAYDSCPNACKYCYANQNPEIAKENFKKHDSHSPLLLGNVELDDKITQGNQATYLKNEPLQMPLFVL
mgnify:CR=1 FL=1